MRNFLILFLFFIHQPAFAQSRLYTNRFSVDPYGNTINPASLPKEIEKRTVRLGKMEVGEHVQVFANAMSVDDSGRCWLNPQHVAFPLKRKGDLEVINNKLGYIVRVNYRYVQTERGFSIPRTESWTRGYVPLGWIPVKAVMVDKPHYEEPSSSHKLSQKMQQPPHNPYSLEKQNVRHDYRRPGVGSSPTNGTPGDTSPGKKSDPNRSTPRNPASLFPELLDGID